MMFRFLTGTRRCRQYTELYNHNAVGEVGRQVIVRMIAVAMVFTVLGCGSDDSGAPMNDWSLEVAGLPPGPSAVGEIRSSLTGGTSACSVHTFARTLCCMPCNILMDVHAAWHAKKWRCRRSRPGLRAGARNVP